MNIYIYLHLYIHLLIHILVYQCSKHSFIPKAFQPRLIIKDICKRMSIPASSFTATFLPLKRRPSHRACKPRRNGN